MSSSPAQPTSAVPDLSICEREPIQTPSAVESHGALLVLNHSDLVILQVSDNAQRIVGALPEALLGKTIGEVMPPEEIQRIASGQLVDGRRRYIGGVHVRTSQTNFDCLIHKLQNLLIIELEPSAVVPAAGEDSEVFASLTDAMAEFDGRLQLAELCSRVATHVRHLTGFDRVMVYRFLEDDSGSVIAEDRREDLIPYLGLRYPASDIPIQARRLYLVNTLRLKPDVNAQRARLIPATNPVTGGPLDMTFCILRAMSPVHDEYLRNMGVIASMSISILKDGRLWGLIACHHTQPKRVPHAMRTTCEVLARVFSSHIAAAEEEDKRTRSATSRDLVNRMAAALRGSKDAAATLAAEGNNITTALKSEGAAICVGGKLTLCGRTPTREQVEALAAWLRTHQQQYIFATGRLATEYPAAGEFASQISGLLSICIALGRPDFVIWFRPAIVQVINWAGDPAKPVEETEAGKRISPRRSFELWKQTVHDSSEPWDDADREFALAIRPIIAESLLLEMNEVVHRLNFELTRSNVELDSFAYAASHDLKEPIRMIRSYAQLLTRRSGPGLDPDSRELLTTIENSADRMQSLTTALLGYSQVGGAARRERKPVSVGDVLGYVLLNLDESVRESGAVVTRDALPVVRCDPDHLVQLLQNLIGNAIKYRAPSETPQIHIAVSQQHDYWHFSVADNGEGFDPAYAEVIFLAFKRLHGHDVQGSGIGLATCRRVVEHYGGRIWAESAGKGQGATFRFTLPRSASE